MIKKTLVLFLSTLIASTGFAKTLYEVYTEALHNDPTFQQALFTEKAADEDIPQAWAAVLPTIAFTGSATANKTTVKGDNALQAPSSTTRGNAAEISLDQVIFDATAFQGLSYAKKAVKAAESTKAAALQDLMIRVSKAYFAVLQAEEDNRYAESKKHFLKRNLDEAQQKYNVGLNTITDVNLAQASYSSAVASLAAADNKLNTSREDLQAITGQDDKNLAQLNKTFPLISPAPLDIEKWVQVAIKRNWTLEAARYTAEAAHENININRSGHFPTIDAELSYSRTQSNNSSLGKSTVYQPQAMLTLSVPIFTGGNIMSKTRQAIANYEVSDQAKEYVLRATINSTRSNYLGVIAAIAQIKADQTAIKASESALNGMEAGYKLGTQTMVDVLSAQDNLFDNQTSYASDRYNYLLTTLALKQAAGTLQAKDLMNINAWLDTSGAQKGPVS